MLCACMCSGGGVAFMYYYVSGDDVNDLYSGWVEA